MTASWPPWLRVTDGAVEVHVRVVPRASRNAVTGIIGDRLKVAVTSPPVEGAANDAVLEVVAKGAGLPARVASLVSGRTGRSKTVRLETADPAGTARILTGLVEKAPPA